MRTQRACWTVLGVAMALAAALILYLNRGTTFFLDELAWVYDSPGLSSPGDVVEPHNGHLIAVSRLLYKAVLETFGAEYVAFRLLGVLSVLLGTTILYVYARRRLGAVVALAPALVLLFLGSAWQHVVIPIGFTVIFSIALGLAALAALEQNDRRGDLAACALLVLSIATYTTGVAFAVGAAVYVLLRPDRVRRAWVFAVPAVLYGAWWLWSLGSATSAESETSVSNVLLIPNYAAEALATAIAALTGLSYDFAELSPPGVELGWGRALAILAVIALVLRLRRGPVPRTLWMSMAVLLSYWTLGALAAGAERAPWATRYVYLGALGVVLIAADAVRPLRLTRFGLAVLFAAAAFSMATNIALLRNGGVYFKDDYSAPARAQFTMLELARDKVLPDFNPATRLPPEISPVGAPAGTYYEVRDRYGSLAFSEAELGRQEETVRRGADQVLASALRLRLQPVPPDAAEGGCHRRRGEGAAGAVSLTVPPGGVTLRTRAAGPASVTVGRFAAFPTAPVGTLSPGETAAVRIPTDASETPWRAIVEDVRFVEVCALG